MENENDSSILDQATENDTYFLNENAVYVTSFIPPPPHACMPGSATTSRANDVIHPGFSECENQESMREYTHGYYIVKQSDKSSAESDIDTTAKGMAKPNYTNDGVPKNEKTLRFASFVAVAGQMPIKC